MTLTSEQVRRIEDYIRELSKVKSEFQKEMKDRQKKEDLIRRLLSKEELKNLDEFRLGELISNLWATQMWSKKDYLVNQIISANGLEKIKKEFKNLLYGGEDFQKRYDTFIKNVKGIGPAMLTEILCFFNPNEFGIWNDKARKALRLLGFEKVLPLNKYQIRGSEYVKFNQILKEIAKVLEKEFENVDLLFVDYFLYKVWEMSKMKFEPTEEVELVFDHDEIRDKIRDIGTFLGFEAETEKMIGYGSRVDVIWSARIGNLGVVTYVFEVHKSGSIDSLIINLQRAAGNPTVQRVIAVSNAEQLEKIKKMLEGLPSDFLKKIGFWDVREVDRVYELLSEANRLIEKLELVRKEFI